MDGVHTTFKPARWGRGRTLGLIGWLFIPLLGAAYHYGPGQERLKYDDAGAAIAEARAFSAKRAWPDAIKAYEKALAAIPAAEVATTRRLRLEKAKAQMANRQLPLAHADLKGLLDELIEKKDGQPTADDKLIRETRTALASSQYYMTWLMRLEGVPRAEWEPEIEASRQHYALLENASDDSTVKRRYQKDLAASIRLARMDLSELQGLPIPSQ